MSNLRVNGPTPSASDPTAVAAGSASGPAVVSGHPGPAGSSVGPAAGSPGPGVLGIGVDVGVVTTPGNAPAVESVPPERQAPTDRFDRDAGSTVSAAPRELETPERPATSPFAGLGRDSAALEERRLSETKVGVERELDPSLILAEKLAALERKLGPEHAARFNKLRLGAMLVTADAQTARETRSAVPQKVIESLAQKILAKGKLFTDEDHRAFLKLQTQFHGAIGQNIQAYVQRVLRECYLIQNQQLMDYADKVRHFNELKKKTREVLEKARATKTTWAAEAKGSESFIATKPFDWLEVGDDGEVTTPAMTAADVEAWRAEAQAAAAGATADGTSVGAVAAQLEALYGESQLTDDERDTLDTLKKNKDTSRWDKLGLDLNPDTDDYIRDHIDELLPLIPKMNEDELKTYLLPIMAILSGGNADEAELLQIFGALNPAQFLDLKSGAAGVDAPESAAKGNGKGARHGAAVGATAGAAAGPLGALAGAFYGGLTGALASALGQLFGGDIFDEGEQAELDQLGRHAGRAVAEAAGADFSGDLTAEKAGELLAALNAKTSGADAASPGAAAAGEPVVGSPKQIRTIQGMEDYIKKLEDDLNSIGDDAQLANVDLQNELQKQEQTLQMLTNISKILHDTALAIVRKIGG